MKQKQVDNRIVNDYVKKVEEESSFFSIVLHRFEDEQRLGEPCLR